METHTDWLGLAGLIVGLAALVVAIIGIRDVREQVKYLVTLERGRSYARVLHKITQKLLLGGADREYLSDMHEFTLLLRALDPKQTLTSAQEFATKEALATAQETVNRGLAKWSDDIDPDRVSKVLKEWQDDKNAAKLRKIFADRLSPPLAEPYEDLLKLPD